MPKILQLRRGNTSFVSANTPFVGELLVNTDTSSLVVGDGSTAGGIELAQKSFAQAAFNAANNATDTWVRTAANSSSSYANSAFAAANTKFSSSGGTISGDTTITGNLTVSGQTTYANTTTVNLGDSTITLNADLPQASAPSENAGIEVERGSSANVGVIWNESTDKWTFTNDGSNYSNMGSASAESYANSAYTQANTAQTHAAAAFNTANNSVTGLTAGTGITLSGNTGNVTISSSGGGGSSVFNVCNSTNIVSCLGGNGGTGTHNFFVGQYAGKCVTSGNYNAIMGTNAGQALTTGSSNILIGREAGYGLTTGYGNVILGQGAGPNTQTGQQNVIIGLSAVNGTGGYRNVFLGAGVAPISSALGCFNIAIGSDAAQQLNGGIRNVFIGKCAGRYVTTGSDNVLIGNSQGSSGLLNTIDITAGSSRLIVNSGGLCVNGTLFGASAVSNAGNGTIYSAAMNSGATGVDNIFVGRYAGQAACSGSSRNTVFGFYSGKNITTGSCNVLIGNHAGKAVTTAISNVILGNYIGCKTTTGSYNIFMGHCAAQCNIGGSNNIFLGNSAGKYNVVHGSSVYIGLQSGMNWRGDFNVMLGHNSGGGGKAGFSGGNTGLNNTFIGSYSGFATCTGGCNLFAGFKSGQNNSTGNYVTALGACAGQYNSTASNNIFIGCGAGSSSPAGLACITTQSNRIIMGNSSHTCAQIQIAWTTVSDCRDKCIFGKVPYGRSFLKNIEPIEFSFKDRETGCIVDPDGKRRYGFSAQNILQYEGDSPVIVSKENEEKLQVTTDYLIPVLVNAINELAEELETLKVRVQTLEN